MVIKSRTVEEVANAATEKFGYIFPEIADGVAVGQFTVGDEHLNQLDTPYGGLLFNLADIVAGLANLSMKGGGPTISGTMNFVNGCKKGDTLICRAVTDKCGSHISYVSCEIKTSEGVLVATASFTFYQI